MTDDRTPADDAAPSGDGVRDDERRVDDGIAALGLEPTASRTGATEEGRVAQTRRKRTARRPLVARDLLSSATVGLVVLVVLALVCAGLIVAVVMKTRNDAAIAAREAAEYTPPPLSSSAPPVATSGEVVVIGDQTVTRAASGVEASERWPQLLDAEVTVDASSDAGYTAEGSDGDTFVEAASKVASQARVVVFVGGSNDIGSDSLPLARAATEAYAAAAERAPNARLVVLGPLFKPASTTSTAFDDLRSALRSSARIAGAEWVDAAESGWLPASVDTTSDLTAANERAIASRVQAILDEEDAEDAGG